MPIKAFLIMKKIDNEIEIDEKKTATRNDLVGLPSDFFKLHHEISIQFAIRSYFCPHFFFYKFE